MERPQQRARTHVVRADIPGLGQAAGGHDATHHDHVTNDERRPSPAIRFDRTVEPLGQVHEAAAAEIGIVLTRLGVYCHQRLSDHGDHACITAVGPVREPATRQCAARHHDYTRLSGLVVADAVATRRRPRVPRRCLGPRDFAGCRIQCDHRAVPGTHVQQAPAISGVL
jgi:hypothetical protein